MRPILVQHYKGPLYVWIAVATDSTNMTARPGSYAVYYSLGHCEYHFRPLSEFHEMVEWPDGIERTRFITISDPGELVHEASAVRADGLSNAEIERRSLEAAELRRLLQQCIDTLSSCSNDGCASVRRDLLGAVVR